MAHHKPVQAVYHPAWRSYYGLWFWFVIGWVLVFDPAQVASIIPGGERISDFFRQHTNIGEWVSIFGLIISLSAILRMIVRHYAQSLYLTSTSLIYEERFLVIIPGVRHEVRLTDIRGLPVRRGLKYKLLGVGDLAVATAGTGEVEFVMNNIWEPVQVKQRIRRAQQSIENEEHAEQGAVI